MQVKICGLTKEEEATYLNDVGADYAGFVFYPKSKRNISFAQAKAIREQLNPQIQAVAVTVSPDRNMIQEIINSGFDVIQAHGELTKEALEVASIPVWYAINIIKEEELLEKVKAFMGMPQDLQEKVEANRESGFGRYDIMLEPVEIGQSDAIILEFKVIDPESEADLNATVNNALEQIRHKQYDAQLLARGFRPDQIRAYGFAFQGKQVLIGK